MGNDLCEPIPLLGFLFCFSAWVAVAPILEDRIFCIPSLWIGNGERTRPICRSLLFPFDNVTAESGLIRTLDY